MSQVDILGKEKLNGFFQERLINEKVGFLDTIKKNSRLKSNQKKVKR